MLHAVRDDFSKQLRPLQGQWLPIPVRYLLVTASRSEASDRLDAAEESGVTASRCRCNVIWMTATRQGIL